MIPEQKAKELVKKFRIYAFTTDWDYEAKGAKNEYHNAEKCAIIAVDEILDEYWSHDIERKEYWQQVKTEIKKSK
jgi:hypothetical protein